MFRIKYSREAILKLLYLEDALKVENGNANVLLAENIIFFKNLRPVETEFITRIIDKVVKEKTSIDEVIANNLIGWKLERLMIVDRCLLRMGIAESYFNNQKAIVIDEMVRIAKKYGSEESFKIINALLDKVLA
jgi:transcription antitermination factor NusB